MCLLSWRKTNFLCIISILSLKSMSKLINVNCLHFIGCQNCTNVLINLLLYQIQVTALLPFFLSILHLLLQLSKIMLWSTVKLLLAIVMSIIFGPLKTLPRSSKSCDFVTFRVLKYLLSIFLLYTHRQIHSLLPRWIWIIFYTIVVHEPRVCHDHEQGHICNGQGQSEYKAKTRVLAITPYCHVWFEYLWPFHWKCGSPIIIPLSVRPSVCLSTHSLKRDNSHSFQLKGLKPIYTEEDKEDKTHTFSGQRS